MDEGNENATVTVTITTEGVPQDTAVKKVSPPSTPAPDPSEQEGTLPNTEDATAAALDEEAEAEAEEGDSKQPLISGGKGKEKAKKERDSEDSGKKKKKRKSSRRRKEGGDEGAAEGAAAGAEGGSHKKKRRSSKRRPTAEDGGAAAEKEGGDAELSALADAPPDYNQALLASGKLEKNPYEPTVEYVDPKQNGTQSTSIRIQDDEEDEDLPEIREINQKMINQYGIFAIASCVCCFFPIGLVAIFYAYKSKESYLQSDELSAYKQIKRSKLFSQIASVIGFLLLVLIAIIVMISYMS